MSLVGDECLTVAKSLNSLVVDRADAPITWCVEITNTGNVALTAVTLDVTSSTSGARDVLDGTGRDVLLPTESIVVAYEGTISAGGVVSEATVIGVPVDADGNVLDELPLPVDDDDAAVLAVAIDIQTTVAPGADADCTTATELELVPDGDAVTWCFVVTNTGSTDLQVTEVLTDVPGIQASVPAGEQTLAPGESIELSANGVADGDQTLIGSVVGIPLDDDGVAFVDAPEVEDEDPAAIQTPVANLSIVKSNSEVEAVEAGDTVTFSLVVTNQGPNAAQQVLVIDTLPAGLEFLSLPGHEDWVCAVSSLVGDAEGFQCLRVTDMEPGTSDTLTYEARVTAVSYTHLTLPTTPYV